MASIQGNDKGSSRNERGSGEIERMRGVSGTEGSGSENSNSPETPQLDR